MTPSVSRSNRAVVIAKIVGRSALEFTIGVVLVFGVAALVGKLTPIRSLKNTDDQDLALAVLSMPILVVYALHVRFVQRRAVADLPPRFLAGDLLEGLLIAGTVMGLSAGFLSLVGDLVVTGVAGWSHGVAMTACSALFAGVAEEVFFRGLLMRLLEQMGGTWAALVVTSVLFGCAHAGNSHVSLAGILGTSGLGLLLGAAYLATRRLWLPIALHAGWNFTMAGVFGVANSGLLQGSILTSQLKGSAWLTGGTWGFEASVETTLLAFAFASWFIRQVQRRGHCTTGLSALRRPSVA